MENFVNVSIVCGISSLFIFILYALDKPSRPDNFLEWASASTAIGIMLGALILMGNMLASEIQKEFLSQYEINQLAFHSVSMLGWLAFWGCVITFIALCCGEEIRWYNIRKVFTACVTTTVLAVAALMTSAAVRDQCFEKPIELEPIERIYFEDN